MVLYRNSFSRFVSFYFSLLFVILLNFISKVCQLKIQLCGHFTQLPNPPADPISPVWASLQ